MRVLLVTAILTIVVLLSENLTNALKFETRSKAAVENLIDILYCRV